MDGGEFYYGDGPPPFTIAPMENLLFQRMHKC